LTEASSALGVGEGTTAMIVAQSDEEDQNLKADDIRKIKDMWKIEEAPVRPINITSHIRLIIGK
jgi:hypothetical protein